MSQPALDHPVQALSSALTASALTDGELSSEDLPRLFAEFSRVTAELASSHQVLLDQVDAMKAELAVKNRELERKKRLEALGRVAAGVAHEFRNPLGGIRLTLDALLREDLQTRTTERVEHVSRAVAHLDRIVGELLTFTRVDPPQRVATSVAELVAESLDIAFVDRDERRQHWTVEGPDHQWLIDRTAFSQVLINLFQNASQALDCAERAAAGVWWGVDSKGAPWIEVADDGDGIPEGEDERIFHPFHTLREHGTGLGLAIVHSRVEAHAGDISVGREPRGGGGDLRGARFLIRLPVAAHVPNNRPEETP